jgi:hypothetical protein
MDARTLLRSPSTRTYREERTSLMYQKSSRASLPSDRHRIVHDLFHAGGNRGAAAGQDFIKSAFETELISS